MEVERNSVLHPVGPLDTEAYHRESRSRKGLWCWDWSRGEHTTCHIREV